MRSGISASAWQAPHHPGYPDSLGTRTPCSNLLIFVKCHSPAAAKARPVGRDPATGGPGAVFFTSHDGSWCELSTAAADGTRQGWEGGPRHLWASIEAAMDFWRHHGEPGWDRFGLTITPHHQEVWLDTPDSNHRWPVDQCLV